MKRSWIHLVGCLLALSHLPACWQGTDRTDRSEAVVLGLIASIGRNRPALDGAVLAAEEINAAGGIQIDGEARSIELIAEDSLGQPETAVSKALKLINRDRAVALIGVPRSYNAIPVARVAESHGIPLITTMSTNPEVTAGKRYVFRLAFLDTFQGRVLADFAYDGLGARRAAVLFNAVGPYNTYLSEIFSQSFRGRGGQVVAFETFTEDDLEIGKQLQRIVDNGAEILFMPNAPGIVKLHVRAARRSGFAGTFLGSDRWSLGNISEQPELSNAYFSDLWAPDQPGERSAAFIEGYRRAFNAAPTASAALSYDAVKMIAQALAGSGPEPAAIRDALAGLGSFQGVSGTIAFRGSGDPQRSVFIRRFDDDGQIRLHREISP